MKYCKYCKQFKLESEFYSNKSYKDGLSSKCKSCQADYARVYNQTHKEQIKQYKTSYYSNEQNRQHHANYNKIYYKNHKEKLYQQQQQRYKQDSRYKLDLDSSRLLNKALKSKNIHYNLKWFNYTKEQLHIHLELLFTPEMSWNNYGTYWEVDHIIPKNLFSYLSPKDKDFKLCWSLENLRPLERNKNKLRKQDGSDISEELKIKILNQTLDY